MAERVKPKRRYDSSRRREQAAATRREILAAAQRLFEAHGYAGTTMAAIAEEAGVAVKTVYLGFETKSNLLRMLWNARLRGDEDDIPVGQRHWYQEVIEEPDPERKLRLNARNARNARERMGRLLGVIRSGGHGDADVAALWNRIQTEFYEHQRRILETLPPKALRRGLDADRAADILWTLNHPDVWLLLVDERDWTAEQWEEWFADISCAQLLNGRPE